ncbi:autophagy-related protein 27 [Cunninghamella echinulata]|nr:autophagy-related protein 27 [Cunninghamella echinulata]
MKTNFIFLGLVGLFSSNVLASQSYCEKGYKPKSDAEYQLDLTPIKKQFKVEEIIDTTPAKTIKRIDINICDPLTKPSDVTKDEEFCKSGAYVCRTKLHKRGDSEATIDVVKDIAGDFSESQKLDAKFEVVSGGNDLSVDGFEYRLSLNGGKDIKGNALKSEISLKCDRSKSADKPGEPTVTSFENGVLKLEWKTIAVCGTKIGEAPPPDKSPDNGNGGENKDKEGKSAIGWFFTILGVALGVYFVGGAFYNYKVYNARGLDLIPHRDFWLDLPYLIKDLLSHLWETILSRRHGSGGYVSV